MLLFLLTGLIYVLPELANPYERWRLFFSLLLSVVGTFSGNKILSCAIFFMNACILAMLHVHCLLCKPYVVLLLDVRLCICIFSVPEETCKDFDSWSLSWAQKHPR